MIEAAVLCMALNLYHEARGEPLEGQFAVAQVTLNRAKRDPEKVCDAVRAKAQFSWTLNPTGVKDKEAWGVAQTVAKLSFHMRDFTNGADHYHAVHVYPTWAPAMAVTGYYGNHIFYKRRGK
jgi:spore germination cell wall hydrolase CwlJ-like protein